MNRTHIAIPSLIAALAVFLAISFPVVAQVVDVVNPIEATSVPGLVNNAVKTILGIVGALALFMFVYGGMLWMTSGGNSGRIEKGKDTLIWATIGLFIIFASYAILNFILTALAG
ncbi:MAG: hypothetical protein HY422_02550 [Candidatus Komeilibacteria bacterium]|nr:hypothetical protein [Candidatus Komeilibacteria bacterium]